MARTDAERAKHAAYMREYSKRRYREEPTYRAANRAARDAWRDRNRDVYLADAKAYYHAHREHQAAQKRKRVLTDPVFRATKVARSHAHARGYKLRHTPAEWEARKAEYGYACAWCSRTDKPLERDHVIPVKGGDPQTVDLITNIVPSCHSCNSKRGRAAQLASKAKNP